MSHPTSILSFAASTVLAASAMAQCEPGWLPVLPEHALSDKPLFLISYRGDLIASGDFTHAGGVPVNHIARWDGRAWSPLGEGIGLAAGLLVHQDELIAIGTFYAAGQFVGGVARWNGDEWSPIGSVYPYRITFDIRAFTLHEGDIVVAGHLLFFNASLQYTLHTVARLHDAVWEALDDPPSIPVALASHDGQLFAAIADQQGPPSIVRWDGRDWLPTAPLITVPGSSGSWPGARMTVYDGSLVVGGGLTVQHWDGSSWRPLGGAAPAGYALAAYRDELIATMHTSAIPAAMAWNGSTWSALPTGSLVGFSTLTVHDHSLIAGSIAYPHWARWGCACYADCDSSTALSAADFGCFQIRYVLADLYADCNDDQQLTIADFGCFQTKYVLGCP